MTIIDQRNSIFRWIFHQCIRSQSRKKLAGAEKFLHLMHYEQEEGEENLRPFLTELLRQILKCQDPIDVLMACANVIAWGTGEGLDLQHMDLRAIADLDNPLGYLLEHSDLSYCNISGVHLDGLNLGSINLQGCRFDPTHPPIITADADFSKALNVPFALQVLIDTAKNNASS